MKVTLQIVGCHPRWMKIDSIKAIRAATGTDLYTAKKMVNDALNGLNPYCEVEGLPKAMKLAQKLADLGAIVTCAGEIYDSYKGDDEGIPYRKEAIGRMYVQLKEDNTFEGTLIAGIVPDDFVLSVPINDSLDFRTDATVISRNNQAIGFKILSIGNDEFQMWQELVRDSEVDIHKKG